MKKHTSRQWMIPQLLVAALFAMTSIAAEEKRTTTVDLVQIEKGLGVLQSQVTAAVTSLEALQLTGKKKMDLRPDYAKFGGELKKLESQMATLRAQGTQMKVRAEDHYRAWQDQLSKMGNPKLRDKAQNRYSDVKQEFEAIIASAEEAKRDMAPFLADLKDVATYLDSDLSTDALKSLGNTIWKLGNKSRSVVASIQDVRTQIGKTLEIQPQSL
jgi:predicted  nucleic acid-binding Zn-ribbon protein